MQKILVTGGSGFIGTNLVQKFLDQGDSVLNFDIQAPRNSEHSPYWRKGDLLSPESLRQELENFQPDLIFHMAARTDLAGKSVEDYSANTRGVRNLIEAAREIPGLKRILFASSMLVCRIGYVPKDEFDYQPSTYYGESKIIGEQIVRQESGDSFSWSIVRPTSIWGPWFGPPYRNFFEAVDRGIYFHPKGKRIRRNYGFVLNSIFELQKLSTCEPGKMQGRTFYLADYEPLELKGWGDIVSKTMGKGPIREVPLFWFQCAAKVGDLLKTLGMSTPPMSSFRLNNMLTDMIHNTRPLEEICGPLPYSPEEAVRLTVEWMREHN